MSTPLEELERLKEQAGDLSDIRRGSPRFKEREGYWREFQFVEALVRHADYLLSAARVAAELREINAMVSNRLAALSETSELRRRSATPACILEFSQLLSNLSATLRDSARKEG
jgi:hypothetical protein